MTIFQLCFTMYFLYEALLIIEYLFAYETKIVKTFGILLSLYILLRNIAHLAFQTKVKKRSAFYKYFTKLILVNVDIRVKVNCDLLKVLTVELGTGQISILSPSLYK